MAQNNISFIDLPYDCQVPILRNLTPDDLLNVREADIIDEYRKKSHDEKRELKISQFEGSLVDAYKRATNINAKKPVLISMGSENAYKDMRELRLFGHAMEALSIAYVQKLPLSRRYERAKEDLISNHCWNLSSIQFSACGPDAMNELDKPFEIAENISFLFCDIGLTLGKFNKWFPKTKKLVLFLVTVSDPFCIHVHLPEIQTLNLSNRVRLFAGERRKLFSNFDLKIFLLLNPQLKHLKINHDKVDETLSDRDVIIIDWELLTFINEHSKLETLTLNLADFDSEKEWPSAIPMRGLHSLVVIGVSSKVLTSIKIKSVKQLTLQLKALPTADSSNGPTKDIYYEKLAKFVLCVKPEKLTIIADKEIFAADKLQFLRNLPKLLELVIMWSYEIRALDNVLNILNICGTLKKLKVFFTPTTPQFAERGPLFLQMDLQFEERRLQFEEINPRFLQMDLQFEESRLQFEGIIPRFLQVDPQFEERRPQFEERRPQFEEINPKFAEMCTTLKKKFEQKELSRKWILTIEYKKPEEFSDKYVINFQKKE